MKAAYVFEKVKKMIADKNYRTIAFARLGWYNKLSDEEFIKKIFEPSLGYPINLEDPKSYSEKLQWLKLHDRNPAYTMMVDKATAKEYISGIIGEKYVIPTLGVWDRFDDIDFSKLPDQFVLKCTHDSGGIVICKDKNNFDIAKARKVIETGLKKSFYYFGREYPYKDVKHRIIAEKYMEDSAVHELRDYKFFTFNGKVKALFVAADRQTKGKPTTFDFFDENYNHLPIKQGHPNAAKVPDKPVCFDEMKTLAEKLAEGIPHVRVDFYEVNGNVYVGELTFYHFSGFTPFVPQEWDYKFGEWLDLTPLKTANR